MLEEIQNELEESVEEDNWDGIGDVISKSKKNWTIHSIIIIPKIGRIWGSVLEFDRCCLIMGERLSRSRYKRLTILFENNQQKGWTLIGA